MTTFESSIKVIPFSQEAVYSKISDLNNLEQVKDRIPQDKIQNFEFDAMAYTYLPQSVMNFPKPKDFLAMMEECGFKRVSQKALTFGLCRIFEGFV